METKDIVIIFGIIAGIVGVGSVLAFVIYPLYYDGGNKNDQPTPTPTQTPSVIPSPLYSPTPTPTQTPSVIPSPLYSPTPTPLKRPTESAMSGDAILHYRIVSKSKTQLTIDVDYTYNRLHGEVVYIGASLYYKGDGIGTGYYPAQVPTVESGTARVTLSFTESALSDELEVFLYEPYKGPFVRRSFLFEATWEPSG